MTEAKSTTKEVVPLRKQYDQIKARYSEHILLFRLGDFYETFDADAVIAAEVLDIVLTARDMGKGNRVPLADIPYHAADAYIAKLVQAGHKVAICEQISEPTKGKGLVDRDVTRVVTPGTITDPAMLDARSNNYITAIVVQGNRAGIAYADITTGEFRATELQEQSPADTLLGVGRELLRLQAAEIVVAADFADDLALPQASWIPAAASISKTDGWRWQEDRAARAIHRHFETESLDGFGLTGKPFAIRAAGGLLHYLEETQLSGMQQITSIATYSTQAFMTLDAQTRRNLELTESATGNKKLSLIAVLDATKTPMGARMLRSWLGQPLLDVDGLNDRLDVVEWGVDHTSERAAIREVLKSVGDIERLANRITTRVAGPRELVQLRTALAALPDLEPMIGDIPGSPKLPDLSQTTNLLQRAIVAEPPVVLGRGQVFRSGFASDLDGHRARAMEAREWIANLERTERERSGLKTLKVGYNKVFGYYLEITTAALANAERERMAQGQPGTALPVDYIAKQSLTTATRYFTPQLKEYETLVLTAEGTLNDLEAEEYRKLLTVLSGQAGKLLQAADVVARVDIGTSLADVAVHNNFVRPILAGHQQLRIVDGRHPVLEHTMPRGEYIANDARLDTVDEQIVILTGPNMAGKSSYLRQVALITLMAQIGSFVPATAAEIGIVDRIFTRIGAANILHHATQGSLVVLDEIGRGTSTYDGLAIARAIVEYMHNAPGLGAKTLFATHYHELTELAELLPRVHCSRMDVLEDGDRVVFLRKVVPGNADKSYGIHVAKLAGIPKGVTRRAEEILADLEQVDRGAGGRRAAMQSPVPTTSPQMQLTFFDAPDPVLERIQALDVESLTPLDAIRVLFELRQEAKGTPS